MARPTSAVLTDKQKKYVEGRLDGKSKREAALQAGYTEASVTTITAERSEDVKKALAEARSELSDATQIKRADVVEMFQEAYKMSKKMAEPSSMVAAAREIGRMLGFYEPETIKLEMTDNQKTLQNKLMTMSTEQLLELAAKNTLIEGEYEHVD